MKTLESQKYNTMKNITSSYIDTVFNGIPDIMNLYWSMDPMSYLQYLTIVTFHRLNPNFIIRIYYPSKTSNKKSWKTNEQKGVFFNNDINYLEQARALEYVDWIQLDIEEICDFLDNDSPEVYKSDFMRIYVLNKTGGYWSDMDIFYLSSLNDLSYKNLDTSLDSLICSDQQYYIGFIGSAEGSKNFKFLLEKAEDNFNPEEYQSLGSHLYKRNNYYLSNNFTYLDPILLYSLGWSKQGLYYFYYVNVGSVTYHAPKNSSEWRKDQDSELEQQEFPIDSTLGIHWCNGNPYSKIFNNYFNHTNQFEFTSTTLGHLMTKVFATDENYYSNRILQ